MKRGNVTNHFISADFSLCGDLRFVDESMFCDHELEGVLI